MSVEIVEQVAQIIEPGLCWKPDCRCTIEGCKKALTKARAAIDKYTDAMTEGGYVIVPREPTEAMIKVGEYQVCGTAIPWRRTILTYKAMIGVRPKL